MSDHLTELAHEAACDDDEAFCYRHDMKAALHAVLDLHHRKHDGTCFACGEEVPCPTVLRIADALRVRP